ncbi:MAG: DUF1761 domain-containing protein [Cyclobacteriaceae bacterium]|nr:DUF1761 domain-containing protein [Cyclobacteriaceae bacterium HetDA_MAG_MS6]
MNNLIINHKAVWLAALIVQFIPPLIYSEVFFGIRWSELNRVTEADFASFNMPLGLTASFLTGLIAAYAMSWLFARMNIDSGYKGLLAALIIWFAFGFGELFTINLFSLRNMQLTFIDESVVLIKYEVIGVILGSWTRRPGTTTEPEA